jgi:hypothetical protein
MALRLGSVPARQRPGVHLKHRTGRELAPQAGRVVRHQHGAPLRVRQHDGEAAVTQLVRGGVKLFAEPLERCLEQDPARARGPDGDGVEIALAEAAHHVVTELAAAAHVDVDLLEPQPRAHLGNAVGEVCHVGHVLAAHMRRGHDHARAVSLRQARELHGLLEVGGAVVDAGEEVEVDVSAPSLHRKVRFAQAGADPVNVP